MEKTKLFVLLSGGIDSSTVLGMAQGLHPTAEIECVTFDYGQRHKKEAQAAADIAQHYGVDHAIIKLPQGTLSGMLVDKGEDNVAIPNVDYADLPEGVSPTYVSFRNGVMLSILAARAQSWVMEEHDAINIAAKHHRFTAEELRIHMEQVNAIIYCGVHADDAARWAYPDCTPEFIGAMANAIWVGTYQRVRLKAPILEMNKAMVVSTGLQMKVPYRLTWSCYAGGDEHCGVCPTCRSRRDAFRLLRKMGMPQAIDPTKYAKEDRSTVEEELA